MFCYQCQETAKGQGCTIRGVCGKDSTVANLHDLLVYLQKLFLSAQLKCAKTIKHQIKM